MTKIVSFTKSNEFKAVKNTTVPGSSYNSLVHYRTIEVSDINPSKLTMTIRKFVGLTGVSTTLIPLVDSITSFKKMGDKYILDVRG
jgi:hypothetical protein